MKDNNNNRRNFLKTAGAAFVAASVPAALAAQHNEARPKQNNIRQLIIFGGMTDPNPLLPGIFGQACFQLQMRADIGSGGFGTLSDPVFTEINSHFKIHAAEVSPDERNTYIFHGAISESNTNDLRGKILRIRVKEDSSYENCDLSLTIEGTPVQALLVPAVQKVRD